MSEPVDTIVKRQQFLKGKRSALMPFWQEIAENFHPTRAQFTRQFYLSEQFADRLLTSYPLLVGRDLANGVGGILRPRDQDWFECRVDNYDALSNRARAWLQWASKVQRRAMYDRLSQFQRATKVADWDYVHFGNAIITRDTDMKEKALLYRAWHPRDVVWCERYNGTIGEIYREWTPTGGELVKVFGEKALDPQVVRKAKDDPHLEIPCLHCVMPGEDYDRLPKTTEGEKNRKSRTAWVSIFLDVANRHVIQELGSHSKIYTIPRWQLVTESQYAYSMAAVCGLPDARLLQAMTLTILEAGEMSVRPPLLATREAVRSDLAIYSGGVTWLDAEYDERLGEALRPMTIDKSGLPVGKELMADARNMLSEAFFINKLTLPPPTREMTAYEVGERVQEWIRQALPLFEPIESEYNDPLLDDTFEALMRVGAFGAHMDIPRELRSMSVRFRLESPLHQATERKKGALLLQAGQLISEAVQLDPACAAQVNAVDAVRDALDGIGVPAAWMRGEKEAAQLADQQAKQKQALMQTQQVQNAGNAAKALGDAAQTLGGNAGP